MKKQIQSCLILACCFLTQTGFAASCQQGEKTTIWTAPRVAKVGKPLKILAFSTAQPITNLVITLPNGEKKVVKGAANTGQPWQLVAQIDALEKGAYQINALQKDQSLACVNVSADKDSAAKKPVWNAHYETFYSAWIEQLFDYPVDENLSFPSLEPVLRNSERNFLYNYLGANEDKALPATPDCADLAYMLRNYFAWKNGLPMSFRACNRGSTKKPPSCSAVIIRDDFVQKKASLASFKSVNHTLLDVVHSGNARTASANEETDFYPVALRRETLLPGTIYADPYGHVLMIVKWVAQTADSSGMLLAVDAQPDNSVGRKRFWEGTFLFAKTPSAVAGFKAFRPIVNSRSLRSNAELPNYSAEQENLSPDDFYAHLYKLINPQGLEAKQAYEATLTALVEQIETRVKSVDNGELYFQKGGHPIEMPKGAAIFETTGAWEDYATPSRDMRLLIAIKVLLNFPDKIVRYPELFNLTAQTAPQVKAQIEQLHQNSIAQKKIQYRRSDGKAQGLSVADILARKTAFEMSYNPNDCVELRWGAEVGSEEYASCKRHAPAAQRKQMTTVRGWFRETKRPAR